MEKDGRGPAGAQIRFVPNIADKRFTLLRRLLKKVEMSVKKQRLWITHAPVLSAKHYLIWIIMRQHHLGTPSVKP
jgi:hypothetical protein